MLDPKFEKKYIVLKIPQSELKIKSMIESKAKVRGFEIIDIENIELTESLLFPSNIEGVFIFNDQNFETAMIVSYLLKYIPKVFLLSSKDIVFKDSSLIVCDPKYKKISEVIEKYFDDINSNVFNFIVDKSKDGFKYITQGNIRINPYKGLFVAFDHPNLYRKYGWGGTILTEGIVEALEAQGIKCFYEFEPTNEMFGGISKSILRGDIKVDPDILQLLFTIDRLSHTKRIYKALQEGKLVIMCRYVLTNLAYAYKDLPMGFLISSNAQVYWPDMNFVVHYSNPNNAISIMNKERSQKEKFDYDEKQYQVNEGFAHLNNMFKGITHQLEGRRSVEVLTKQSLRIIRSHPKFKQYQENNEW